MKNLLLVVCCFFNFYAFASVDDERNHIRVTNNYLFLLFPEYIPHSVPIKKQELLIKNIQPTSSVSNLEVYSDDNGLIIEESAPDKKGLIMDYKMQVLTRNEKGTFVNYSVQFDDQKNVTEIKDSNQKITSYYKYDEQGKLISSNENVDGKNYIGTYLYDKNNNLIQHNEREIETIRFKKILTFLSTNLYYYDDENRLVSSISKQDDPLLNGKTASLPKDINESKYRTFTCYYSQYNEHGDWTISQCFNGDNELDMSITRKLEY